MRSATHVLPVLVAASVLAGGAAPLIAQSLADVARKEEERRKEIKTPAKVYTNRDLAYVPPVPQAAKPDATKPPSSEAAAANDAAGKDGSTDAKEKGDVDKGTPVAKDQAYWAGRMKDLAADLDRNQTFADALQTRINVLTADFSARDDPAQRAVIGRDRQKSLDELERLKKTVEANRKAIADLQEDARRMGVPPGWLR